MKTREQTIAALTMADVVAAKKRTIEARKTRAGVSTFDFILSGVDGTVRTLEMAKNYLRSI